jgi:undecaprenyl-diphosphatase
MGHIMESFDIALTQWLNGAAGHFPALDMAMSAITAYGVPLLIFSVAAQWFLSRDKSNRRYALVCSGLAFLIGEALNQLILLFVHRPRPYEAGISRLIIEKSADWSFPSDHATAVAAIAVVFVILKWRKQALLFSIAALLVCMSRVFVGTHYASDILGGVLTGSLAAWAVTSFHHPDGRINIWLTKLL